MDEFDRINPFDREDFRPEAETPPQPSLTQEEEEQFPASPPPLVEEPVRVEQHSRQTWGDLVATGFLRNTSESVALQTARQLITKHGDDPTYRVQSKTSLFHGFSVEELKQVEGEIEDRRIRGRPAPSTSSHAKEVDKHSLENERKTSFELGKSCVGPQALFGRARR